MNTNKPFSHHISPIDRGIGGIANIWQKVQDRIARILGAKDSNNLSTALVGGGIALTVAGNMLLPGVGSLVSIGLGTTAIGIAGKVENTLTTSLRKAGGYL